MQIVERIAHIRFMVPLSRIALTAALVVGSALESLALPPIFEGAEFQVNSYTTGDQEGRWDRCVDRLADGSFIVVWDGPDGSLDGVHAQRFDSAGASVGSEFQVNTYTTDYNYSPAVALARDGGFTVVWSSKQNAGSFEIIGRQFDSSGVPTTSEFQVNTYTTNFQFDVDLSIADDNSFVVVWNSTMQDGSFRSIFGQRFDSAGSPVGGEFAVNSFTTGTQNSPVVSGPGDGSFVVAWQGGPGGVVMRRFDSAGDALGTDFTLVSGATVDGGFPRLDAAPDGRFVVTWEALGPNEDIFAQRFDSSGAEVGAAFQANTYTTGRQRFPTIAVDDDGKFLIVWTVSGAGPAGEIYARRFNSDGSPDGGQFTVNTYTTDIQGSAQSVAADGEGNFVVVWSSGTQDGDGKGMFGQLLCNDEDGDGNCDVSCGPTPATVCRSAAAGKSQLQIKDKADDSKDQLKWKWKHGDATDVLDFKDPVGSTSDYLLCLYDSSVNSQPLLAVEVPPGGTCDGKACWKATGTKGFKYKNKAALPAGLTKGKLRAGAAGKAQVAIQAKGANLDTPTLPLSTDVLVQLLIGDPSGIECWENTFSATIKNDAAQFKAKGP